MIPCHVLKAAFRMSRVFGEWRNPFRVHGKRREGGADSGSTLSWRELADGELLMRDLGEDSKNPRYLRYSSSWIPIRNQRNRPSLKGVTSYFNRHRTSFPRLFLKTLASQM